MGIHVFPHDCKDFANNGLCGDLQPIEAYFEEEKNGISQIELTLPYDPYGKWKEVKVGRYIRAMVPVRVTPFIENDSYCTTIQKVKIKSGVKQTYLTKKQDVVYLLKKPDEDNGGYYEKATNLSPDSIVVAMGVAAGIAEIRTENVRTYMYVDDYEVIEQVEIPAALDGVESVTGTSRLKPQFFIVTSVEQTLDCMYVTAQHVFYELLHNATTYKTENKVQGAAACRQVFDNLVSADDRFEIFSDCKDEQKGLDYDRISPVQALLDPDEGICAKYGLSLIRDNYAIYALKNVGTDRGFVVEYGKNMLSVDCIENIDETYTRIIPFGKDKEGNAVYMDGQIWVDSERIKDYAAPRILMLDCTDTASVGKDMNLSQVKAELKRRAEEELANGIDKPDIEMTVDFLSLGDTEEFKQYRDLDKVYMFDRITVKDKIRGYDYAAEVVAVKHNLLTGMLERCKIGSLEKAAAARKIASWQVPTVDGGNIRLQSIAPGLLGADAVGTENIQDGAIVANKIEAKAVTTEKLDAGAVTAEKIAADAVETKHLSADTISALGAKILNADIDWAEIKTLQAAIADITSAEIQNADIDFAKIKDLSADSAIITKGAAGELYISRLAVTEANLVSLSVGQLMVKGADGSFYALSVDENGAIRAEKKLVGNTDIGDQTINAGEKLIEGSITAATLNAREIFGDSALIRQLIASNLDVDTLFAREAMISKLNALDITGNESIRIYVQRQDEMNAFLRVTENGLEIGKVGDPAIFRADNRTLEVTNVKTERLGVTQRMAQNEEWAFAAYGSGLSIKWIGGDV
jgi:phage minor structural protein